MAPARLTEVACRSSPVSGVSAPRSRVTDQTWTRWSASATTFAPRHDRQQDEQQTDQQAGVQPPGPGQPGRGRRGQVGHGSPCGRRSDKPPILPYAGRAAAAPSTALCPVDGRAQPEATAGILGPMTVPGSGPRFLQLADVAETLNISSAQVYALVRSGDLPAIKIGGRGQWRVEAIRAGVLHRPDVRPDPGVRARPTGSVGPRTTRP